MLQFRDTAASVMALDGINNFVGIGTFSATWAPVSRLHVDAASGESVVSVSRNNASTTNVDPLGSLQAINGTYAVAGVAFVSGGATRSGSIVFRTANNTATGNRAVVSEGVLERMRVTPDGNVGIGDFSTVPTINPTSYLSINTGPLGTSFSDVTNGQHALMIGSPSTGGDYFLMGVDQRMDLAYMFASVRGGSARPIVMQPTGGGVSIGTYSNTAKLHILATTPSSGFRLNDTTQGINKALVSDATGHGSWLTYSNILAAVSGVTGSGTINYVPYWLGPQRLSSTSSIYINAGNVGIGLTAATGTLHVRSSVANSTVVEVDGVSGELFSITDSLSGSLFSVNDVSGIPVIEAFSDSTVVLGNYQAPVLYTTVKSIVNASTTNAVIYQVSTTNYSSAFFDYNVTSGTNSRTGTITSVWNTTGSVEYNDVSTLDVGNALGTGAIDFNVFMSGANVQLRATTAAGQNWTIKVIVRAI